MGRGRSGALFLVLFVGVDSASFTAEGNGEGTAARLGWTDTNICLLVKQMHKTRKVCIAIFVCGCLPVVQEDCPSEV